MANEIDNINHPAHYKSNNIRCSNCKFPIECIEIARNLNFNLGNAIKYIWRAEHKEQLIQDLKKASWYILDEIKRLENR